MAFHSETDKIRDKVLKYLNGFVVDIGCGDSKILNSAFGIDGRNLDGVSLVHDNLYNLEERLSFAQMPLADVVFSSHVLEHLSDHYGAIKSWTSILKTGGFLILYLPDGRHYNNYDNPEHMVNTNYDDFMFWFSRTWCGEGKDFRGQNFKSIYQVVESGMDVGEDRYSFYVVAQKL
jgi:predicted SAM-dependent methyltransferase